MEREVLRGVRIASRTFLCGFRTTFVQFPNIYSLNGDFPRQAVVSGFVHNKRSQQRRKSAREISRADSHFLFIAGPLPQSFCFKSRFCGFLLFREFLHYRIGYTGCFRSNVLGCGGCFRRCSLRCTDSGTCE